MISFKLYHPRVGYSLQPPPGAACDQCRRKKARCNRKQPCEGCKRNLETCSYSAPKTRGRRPRARPNTELSTTPYPAPGLDAVHDKNEPAQTIVPRSIDLPSTTKQDGDDSDAISATITTPSSCQQGDILQSPCETDLLWNTYSPASLNPQHSPKGYTGDDIFVERNLQLHEPDAALWTTRVAKCAGYEPSPSVLRYPNFVPYVRIYLERLYSVFPVVDREFLSSLLNPESQDGHIPVWLYAFLSALSAAVIVQLNVTDIRASDMGTPLENEYPNRACVRESIPGFSPQLFISQCMQARQQHAFIEEADEWTILTSFFLFVAHDNLNQPKSASYYLREAIGFVEALQLGEPESYIGLDPDIEQRRKRLFWLLFVTERAYAIQHRRRAILRPTIDPPRIFECRDPRLAYGFASLVKVFATIDEPFIAARMNEQTSGDVDLPPHANQSIARLLDHSTTGGVLSMSEIDETQRLDITVTQHWIRILACQLRMASSPRLASSKTQLAGSLEPYVQRVLDTSKSLLRLISSATPASLECHGLGMERKIADAANCLCDVIANVGVEDFVGFFTAPEYLHSFMMFLSDFRNRESQCLQPLAQRATIILAARLDPMNSLGALGEEVGPPRRRDSEVCRVTGEIRNPTSDA